MPPQLANGTEIGTGEIESETEKGTGEIVKGTDPTTVTEIDDDLSSLLSSIISDFHSESERIDCTDVAKVYGIVRFFISIFSCLYIITI